MAALVGPPPPPLYDRARAKKLMAEAGYPNGLDAGDYTVDAAALAIGEPVANSLQAAGIRLKLRPLERAAFQKGYGEKKYRNLVHPALYPVYAPRACP